VRTAAPVAQRGAQRPAPPRLSVHVLHEDDALLVINKPAGIAVHGGSGISQGVIERLRTERPELKFLELVHRLDRETSGVLLLAKKRSALTNLHAQIRAGTVQKRYSVMVHGRWTDAKRNVRLPLYKFMTAEGERRVSVNEEGVASHTVFRLVENRGDYSMLDAQIMTGRTHQIRVHLAHLGFPILGDDKYGDFALNKRLQREGLKRMFLHAARVEFAHPTTKQPMLIEASLAADLQRFVETLPQSQPATTRMRDGQTV
jgi:23S rRNA pseudouridine955/2504/2580 synthase